MSTMTYDEALEYAKRLRYDVNVMVGTNGDYRVIDFHAVEHWSKHLRTVAEVRIRTEVKEIK